MFLREECLQKLETALKTKSGLSEDHIKDIMFCAKLWPDNLLDRIASDVFEYLELHVHSDRSPLDGLGTVIDHALVAASYGHPGLAITDHGKTSGWSDYMFSKKIPSNFKKIYGCEVYVNLGTSDMPSNQYVHLLLLAKNNLGRKNVLRLVSKASIGGINVRAKATIPMDAFTTESLRGVIVTTACLGGPLAHIFTEESEKEDFDAEKCYLRMKEEALRWKSISEHFYLEVQNYEADNAEDFNSFREDEVAFANQQLAYNEFLYRISAETGIPVVATNDCHYQKPEDAEIQDILLCISTKKSLADPDRLRFQSKKHFIKTKWYMLWLFRQHPEAVCNTEEILNLINYEEEKHGYYLPLYPLTDTKEEQIAIFHELVSKGLREFYGKPENLKPLIEKFGSREKALNTIKERADFEKEVLLNMGFEGYMLLVSWCIEIARENNVLVGHGRGSAAGSIVALALKITDLCPLRYDLIFERFLNPDRISMPDIDVDYQYEHRAHVIELIQQKIGADKMAQIVTFGRMKAKAAIRNAGKVLDIPLTTVDKIAKMIPMGPKVTIASAIEESSALQAEIKNPQIAKLIEVAKSIEGRIKNTSVHAAGVILSSVPITDVCALENGKGAILPVVQAEMSNVDYLGLVKQDFLGLRTLSVIAAAIDFINKRHNVGLRYEDIPRDDAKTYKLLAAGETTACFQLESAGMQQLMRDIHIETVSDVIDCIALFRPGVLKVGMHKEYVKNKYNPQNISYIHPLMEKVLAPSRGILIYQEQAMQLSNHLAGFTMAEADTLRKAIGKKNLELMAELKEKFVVGCKKTNNIDSQTATKIWELIEVMSGYSFNKSHSAAYAMTSIDTAYLKANYPIEFMTAAISKAAEGKSPKLATYLEEARRMGIPVLAPDINKSETWFSISENDEIVFGLQAIKDVGKCADQIVEERLLNGPFTDIVDFRKRCQFANKKTLVSLVKVGAFDKLGYNRNVLLAVLDDILKIKPKVTKKNPEPHFNEEYNILYPEIEAPSKKEILNLEMELCSIFITDHPFSEFLPYVESNIINGGKGNRVEDFHSGEMMDESWVYFGAYVLNEKITKTKKGDEMAILTLDDISAQVDAVIFPAVYEKVKDLVTEGESFMFKGKLQYKEDFFSKSANSSEGDADDEGSADMIPQIIINAVETFPAVKNTAKDEDFISLDVWSKGKTITIC